MEFEQIVRQYSEKIYFVVRRIVVDHHDANDVVQNTLIKVWQNLPSFQGKSSLYTWIYRIAVNEALTFLRSSRAHLYATSEEAEYQLRNLFDQDPYFDGDAAQAALAAAICTLPPKQRIVFNMRYWDNMPYAEMAEVLHTSEGALKASYHHAVKKIEAQLNLSLNLDI